MNSTLSISADTIQINKQESGQTSINLVSDGISMAISAPISLSGDVAFSADVAAPIVETNEIQAYGVPADVDLALKSKGAGTVDITGNVELQGTATLTATSGILTDLISPSSAGPFYAIPSYADGPACEAVLTTPGQGVRWFKSGTGKICFTYNNGGAFIHDESA